MCNFKFQISNFKSPLKSQILNFKSLLKSQISNFKSLPVALLRSALLTLPARSADLPSSRFQPFTALLAGLLLSGVPVLPVLAQTPAQPYAVIPRDAVNYAGPGRDASYDLEGTEIKIGLLAPLTGSEAKDGKALLQAAQMAVEDDAAIPLPQGRRLRIVPRDQSGPWGRASSEIVHLVYEDRAVAILTSLDGASAHLAEQVANKAGIPILTLSSDPTTTEINLPWIFRLGPTDTEQARAFAQDIYRARRLERVVLLAEIDHDGRVGGEEFQKAARALNAPPGIQLAISPAEPSPDSVLTQIMAQSPEALVFWTGHETASELIPRIRRALPSLPIYLCREAAPELASADLQNIWIAGGRPADRAPSEEFQSRYRARTGTAPSAAAAQAYDAVRILAIALRRTGPNRARLRDALAGLSAYSGASGVIAFDHAGNDLGDVTLVRLY